MFVVELVSERDEPLVESFITGLAPADQQDRRPTWIESVEHAVRITCVLHPQLSHVGMTRRFDSRAVRMPERRTFFFKHSDDGCHRFLFVLIEVIPPGPELVGVLDFPHLSYSEDNARLILCQTNSPPVESTCMRRPSDRAVPHGARHACRGGDLPGEVVPRRRGPVARWVAWLGIHSHLR